MNDNQVVVFADERAERAYLLRNRLVESGVEAFVVNDATRIAVGMIPPGWTTAAQVVVAAEHLDAAAAIVEEFNAEEHQSPPEGETGSRDREAESAPAIDTPAQATHCPDCGRARTAVCPVCQTASAAFPPADAPPSDRLFGDERAGQAFHQGLLVCTMCDEPFAPGYLRRCEWCGHDFPDGIQPAEARKGEPLDERVTLAIMGLAACVLAVLAYFALIVSR